MDQVNMYTVGQTVCFIRCDVLIDVWFNIALENYLDVKNLLLDPLAPLYA
jgi:hypothetical protein